MSFKQLPILTADEYQKFLALCERTADGCLIYPFRSHAVAGQRWSPPRLMWAETYGEADLATNEVGHITECPNTGDKFPLCIEPTHLCLSTIDETQQRRNDRGRSACGPGGTRCEHGDTDRRPNGQCRICNRAAVARYKQRLKESAHA